VKRLTSACSNRRRARAALRSRRRAADGVSWAGGAGVCGADGEVDDARSAVGELSRSTGRRCDEAESAVDVDEGRDVCAEDDSADDD
jgi:hypothetical protein